MKAAPSGPCTWPGLLPTAAGAGCAMVVLAAMAPITIQRGESGERRVTIASST